MPSISSEAAPTMAGSWPGQSGQTGQSMRGRLRTSPGAKSRKNWQAIEIAYPNLRLIVSPAKKIQLLEGKYDFVMFNLNYHDLYWESTEYKFPPDGS